MKIVTADQMRQIEDRSEALGVSKDALMERAGLESARYIRRLRAPLFGVPIVVLVGPGNNGGDGLVIARHLHNWGARVTAYICRDRRAPDPKLDIVNSLDIPVIAASDDAGLARLSALLDTAHVVVDAVLGIGRIRPLTGTVRDILDMLMATKAQRDNLRIVAIDVPSGMDADSGNADPACPAADITLAMGYPKVGHYAYQAAARIGALDVVEIGLPDGLDDDVPLSLMTADNMRPMLPARPSDAHKGSFGKTMVVAGSQNYIGAAYLAGSAATRIGSGLVTIALPASIQTAVASKAIEPTYLPLAESSPGVVKPSTASDVLDALDGYNSLLVGCGMGQAADTRAFIEAMLYSGGSSSENKLPPTVIDADGLNALAHYAAMVGTPPTHGDTDTAPRRNGAADGREYARCAIRPHRHRHQISGALEQNRRAERRAHGRRLPRWARHAIHLRQPRPCHRRNGRCAGRQHRRAAISGRVARGRRRARCLSAWSCRRARARQARRHRHGSERPAARTAPSRQVAARRRHS